MNFVTAIMLNFVLAVPYTVFTAND